MGAALLVVALGRGVEGGESLQGWMCVLKAETQATVGQRERVRESPRTSLGRGQSGGGKGQPPISNIT